MLFSIVAASTHISTSSVQEFSSLHMPAFIICRRFKSNFLYLFISGCAGPLLPCGPFLCVQRVGYSL